MKEAFLYSNPAKPFGEMLHGGFIVQTRPEAEVDLDDLIHIQDEALAGLDAERLVVPLPEDLDPWVVTAVASVPSQTEYGNRLALYPIGFANFVFNPASEPQNVSSGVLSNIYVRPTAPELGLVGKRSLYRRGIASAMVHSLISDESVNFGVRAIEIPQLGDAQNAVVDQLLLKTNLTSGPEDIQDYLGNILRIVSSGGTTADCLTKILEIKYPWLSARKGITGSKDPEINKYFPNNVVNLGDYRKQRPDAEAEEI